MIARLLILGLAAVAATFSSPALAQDDLAHAIWSEAPDVAPVGKQDRVYGKPDARFSLIIWLDPECPYCKLLGEQPQHVVDDSHGTVNLAIRLYPLPFHGPNALVASTTALCVADQAGPQGYYRFLTAWMARTGSNGRGIDNGTDAAKGDPVADLAAASGARNRDALAGCTTSNSTNARLSIDIKLADHAHIEGTPAIALRDNRGGHTIMTAGAINEDDMHNAVRGLGRIDDGKGKDEAPSGNADGATH